MRFQMNSNGENSSRLDGVSEEELNREHRKLQVNRKELESVIGSQVFRINNVKDVTGVGSTAGTIPYWFSDSGVRGNK